MTKSADLASGKIAALKTALIEFTDGDDAIAVADAGVVTLLTTAVAKSEGGAVTTNITQGLAKCWSNFKGDNTSAINDSFNMASLTDNGTGDYTISFTNDFSNVNYSFAGISMYVGSRVGVFGSEGALTNDGFATGTFRTKTNFVSGTNGEGTAYDARHNGINFHGDLA